MGAPLRRRDQVDITFGGELQRLPDPAQGPVNLAVGQLVGASQRHLRHQFPGTLLHQQVFAKAAVELPALVVLGGFLVTEFDLQPLAQHRLGAQYLFQATDADPGSIEKLRVGKKADQCASVFATNAADGSQLRGFLTLFEGDVVFLAVALDPYFEYRGERVDDRHADPVQATGKIVTLVGELGAGVEAGQNHLNSADPLVLVDIDRHAPTVVSYADGCILVENNLDPVGIPRDRLVDAVVHHLLNEVVGPIRLGIHTGAFTHRVKPGENLDRLCVIAFVAHTAFSVFVLAASTVSGKATISLGVGRSIINGFWIIADSGRIRIKRSRQNPGLKYAKKTCLIPARHARFRNRAQPIAGDRHAHGK